MSIILFDIQWMSINIFLALLGVLFGYIFFRIRNIFLKVLFFVLWILFLPNTIYLLTDLQYLPDQLPHANIAEGIILLYLYIQLIVIGIVTFIVGFKPIEEYITVFFRNRVFSTFLIIICNSIIAFAMVMGKIQRTNSWHVFTNPTGVIKDSITTLSSFNSIILTLLFTIIVNIIYFYFRYKINLSIQQTKPRKKRKKV